MSARLVTVHDMPAFDSFAKRRTALLTTYKRDGTPVATPVTIAVDGERAYVRTWDSAWKAKRMRNNPAVLVAPSTVRGRPKGEAIAARSRLLDGEEAAHAARAIARRQPILQGVLVPVGHRLMRYRTLHYELTTLEG
jgi:PPOX class probable F420-dependent enzyme